MTYQQAITALADPRRRAIFESLKDNPRMVADIARSQPVSRPAVSQHLKTLEQAGLVTVQAKGTRRYYGVRREGLAELRQWIDGFWGDVLGSFAVEVARQEKLKIVKEGKD